MGEDDGFDFPDSGLGGEMPDASPAGPSDAAGEARGETCDAPELIVLDVDSATVTGTTTGYARNHLAPPACNVSDTQVDRIYQVEVGEKQSLNVQLDGTDTSVATVSIQRACPDTSLVGGCTVGTPNNGFDATRDYDQAGTAYIFVWANEGVDYTLSITASPLE